MLVCYAMRISSNSFPAMMKHSDNCFHTGITVSFPICLTKPVWKVFYNRAIAWPVKQRGSPIFIRAVRTALVSGRSGYPCSLNCKGK